MTDDLTGRSAFVTGASTGIGRATALELASGGCAVALAARNEDRLHELADEVETNSGGKALALPTDVQDPKQVEAAVASARRTFDGLDVVVVNAGVGQPAPVDELSVEDYRTVMGTNVDGAFFTVRATLPHLRDSTGHLVFVGSVAGRYLEPVHPLYAASKWWLRGFALNLAGAVGEDDIAVTLVNPTAVRTEFGSSYGPPNRDTFEAGRVLEPEDVAETIAFAVRQDTPKTVGEIDLLRRNEFSSIDRF